jgi:hypothetical protein
MFSHLLCASSICDKTTWAFDVNGIWKQNVHVQKIALAS